MPSPMLGVRAYFVDILCFKDVKVGVPFILFVAASS
jgi:hypothetical protein